MKSADLAVLNCENLITCKGPIPKRKQALGEIGLLKKTTVASSRGKIVFIGNEQDFNKEFKLEKNSIIIDGQGFTGLPGFVDSHTHLPFSGTREKEFALRLQGYTYQQLAAQGMGIQTTVQATRDTSLNNLVEMSLSRLDNMLLHGTTTVEAKSGYGLNLEDEIKQLRVLQECNRLHPADIIPTFMGAHEVPLDFKDRKKEYIDFIIQTVLPEVTKNKLAEFFDVFCEKDVYSVEDTRALAQAAQAAGLKVKIHADEFSSLGGAQLAAEIGAISAEHLVHISEEGIQKIARSSTAAILLPGVPFFLKMDRHAPARRLIDQGAVVAIATDFNPGSSMTENMLFILQLAVLTMGLNIEEAIQAATANAAYAVSRDREIGSLETGKKMDLILCDVPNYYHLVYHLGINPVKHVIKDGKIVVSKGQVLKHNQSHNPSFSL